MKITEELLNEMKIKDENFSDGLISGRRLRKNTQRTSSWNDGIASMDRERKSGKLHRMMILRCSG